ALGWRADARHFVRVKLQGDAAAGVFRSIAATVDFDQQRPMTSPFSLGHLPAGMHLSGADIQLSASPANNPNDGPWGITMWFDYGTGRTAAPQDLENGYSGEPAQASYPPIPHPS